MKLTSIERYEIRAEAFRIMTGHMAPGKSASAASNPASPEERNAAYLEWAAAHTNCVRAMLLAFERVMPDAEE